MLPTTRFAPLPSFARQAERSVTWPRGFAAAGVHCGLKKRGKLDLGVLASDRPCVSAATFTQNAAAAAPVRLTRDSGSCDTLRAVVVNAGNANACTGKQGLGDAARMRLLAAQALRVPVEQVAVASTGVIGMPLPMERVEAGIADAVSALRPGGGEHFAQAIRTTDRTPKRGALELELHDGAVRLGVCAKGCGMISPNMATMLCFVTCDAQVDGGAWRELVRAAVDESFNRITVDGQESTNDMVLAMANGAAGVRLGDQSLEELAEALRAALLSLAVAMVADGEGSTCTMKLNVTGAHHRSQAEAVARAVANSPLVKTAFYGRDPNWGRVVQAVGQALGAADTTAQHEGDAVVVGARRPMTAEVAYEDVVLVRAGDPVALGDAAQERLADIMAQPEIEVNVALNGHGAGATVYFSDLTHAYVTLNAEYTT